MTFEQTFGSVDANLHVHAVVLDGVFTGGTYLVDGGLLAVLGQGPTSLPNHLVA